MRLSLKQIKKMNVETVSHHALGSVVDIVCDINSHLIVQYRVRSGVISGHEYLIHPHQILRFEKGKIIVDDTAVDDRANTTEEAHNPPPLPEAAAQ